MTKLFCFVIFLGIIYVAAGADESPRLYFSSKGVTVPIGVNKSLNLYLSHALSEDEYIDFTYMEDEDKKPISYLKRPMIVKLEAIFLPANQTGPFPITLTGLQAGHLILGVNSTTLLINGTQTFCRVNVIHSYFLFILDAIVGWCYFLAWTVSFYPQLILNFRRRSVVGLNFDFLAFAFTGYVCYTIFNVALYWVQPVKDQYMAAHPRGVIPVEVNDVFFCLHAVLIGFIEIIQCFVFKRDNQRLSHTCMVILGATFIFCFVCLILTVYDVFTWLQYVYFYSFLKIGITILKIIPQFYMNYKRKSTQGFSIEGVWLDFVGGSLSLCQMFLLAYNNDDWTTIFGDASKFGLGLLSFAFDFIFFIQHYCMYRANNKPFVAIEDSDYAPLLTEDSENDNSYLNAAIGNNIQ